MKPLTLLLAVSFLLTSHFSYAGSATWNLNPTSGDWNTSANWTPATVPNSSTDIATFDISSTTNLSFSGSVEVDGIQFTASASQFTISTYPFLLLFGGGIINDSGSLQQFLIGPYGVTSFFNSATAGTSTAYTVEGFDVSDGGGTINFFGASTAGDASFSLEGGVSGPHPTGGRVVFNDTASAANARFDIKGGGSGQSGATLAYAGFYDNSTAGNAIITIEGAPDGNGENGVAFFSDQSTADHATLIAKGLTTLYGGSINFIGSAKGDNASIKIFGSGNLSLAFIDGSSLTIGSLEGDGYVNLGTKNLVVGQNNASTTFSGVTYATAGSLTKIGSGTLVLAGANGYTGGTLVNRGRLLTNNDLGSATGTGVVQVTHGAFGGNGFVTGPVTVGSDSGAGATLEPGIDGAGRLTVQNGLTFRTNSRYNCNVQSSVRGAEADEVVASSITIEPNSLFVLFGRGNVALPSGTVFTVISNTGTTPIGGTFSNLADGATFTIGNNAFKANYEGGDGNDLTLTVQ